ncbi:uncharacterized protein BKA55DRAFT_560202 [Fusarium redolens]|jgi:hypothetical protein|uniref:Secreted protein n=1 Tax=Fusarium redolens TaxID=48865 RepID=A0A9P9HP14_FUSRE|nr:uncharacterized protein BKA55DRAFT_560202 [Fusarium redolens]KAH7261040.1 hypothetical protein BKA55DRAFT_560202 [Fusarium redolens]
MIKSLKLGLSLMLVFVLASDAGSLTVTKRDIRSTLKMGCMHLLNESYVHSRKRQDHAFICWSPFFLCGVRMGSPRLVCV